MTADLKPNTGYYLAIKAPLGIKHLDINTVRETLSPILADSDIKKIGQNIKYDMLVLENAKMPLKGVFFDTMVAHYLLQPEIGAEFAGRTLQIPANKAVIDHGVAFETDNEAVANALTQFAIEATKVQAPGVRMNLHPLAFAYYDSSNTRLAQYFAGELTLDEAMARLQEDLDEALANLEG